MANVANYFMAAMVIACFAFGSRILLDAVGFNPEIFLFSLRDFGTAVILVLLLLGLRAGGKVWSSMGPR